MIAFGYKSNITFRGKTGIILCNHLVALYNQRKQFPKSSVYLCIRLIGSKSDCFLLSRKMKEVVVETRNKKSACGELEMHHA